MSEQESERFVSRKKAWEWLQDRGHKVSIGKFYGDCKAGFPAMAPDKSVSKYQVLLYGLDLSAKVQPDGDSLNTRELDHRKATADTSMAEMKAKKMEREENSLWLHADDAWSVVAGLVGNLRDSIRYHLYSGQREVVQTAGGDQDRSQEVFEFTDNLIDKAFNEVAGKSISIKFEKEPE